MKKNILLVDGYNMIGAWPELQQLKKKEELGEARDQLLRILSHYRKYENVEVHVIFDAQLVPGIQKNYEAYHLNVVFTKENETADTYIERVAGELSNRLTQVTVATSDLAEQWLIFSRGALRKSARELYQEIKRMNKAITEESTYLKNKDLRRNSPWNSEQLTALEKLRDGLS